eukprot:jgi/Botrbrau1/1623/Bobra.0185s0038.1
MVLAAAGPTCITWFSYDIRFDVGRSSVARTLQRKSQPCFLIMAPVHVGLGRSFRRECLNGLDRRGYQRSVSFRVSAYHRTEQVQDWRVKQMMDAVHVYFSEILSKGNEAAVDKLISPAFVQKDCIWDTSDLVVGTKRFKEYIKQTRKAYPDYFVEVKEVGVCDMNRLFVQWEGVATNLGEYHGHKPSHHASNVSGINLISFNEDRSLITEAIIYRSPMMEDKLQLEEREGEDHNMHEMHLHRLT